MIRPSGAREDERGAKSELIDWNAESDRCDASRGKHDPQQRQNYRHIFKSQKSQRDTGYPDRAMVLWLLKNLTLFRFDRNN